jgi:hypothetical protein
MPVAKNLPSLRIHIKTRDFLAKHAPQKSCKFGKIIDRVRGRYRACIIFAPKVSSQMQGISGALPTSDFGNT